MYKDCVYNGLNLYKCIGSAHKLAQDHKNYKPYDILLLLFHL